MIRGRTSTGRMTRFQLQCICGVIWEGWLPQTVADKVRRTFSQEHRKRSGHGRPQDRQRGRRRCGKCGALGRGVFRGTIKIPKGKVTS